MQLISKFNKEFRFLLCVIDIFNKLLGLFIWKIKKVSQLLMLFIKFWNNMIENQVKHGSIKEVNFTIVLLKNG